jgi:hypothetical protein
MRLTITVDPCLKAYAEQLVEAGTFRPGLWSNYRFPIRH